MKRKKQLFLLLPFSISALSAALLLIKVTGFLATSARADKLVEVAVMQTKPHPNDIHKQSAKSKEIADQLKKKNLFAPPTPKQHPVKHVPGILGNEALINGKWYKVVDEVPDARIVAIEPTLVRIEWDGKEKVFAPISAAVAAGTPTPRERSTEQNTRKRMLRTKIAAAPDRPVQGRITVAPITDSFITQGSASAQNVRIVVTQDSRGYRVLSVRRAD